MKLHASLPARRLFLPAGLGILALAALVPTVRQDEEGAAPAASARVALAAKYRTVIQPKEAPDASGLATRFLACTDPTERVRLGDELVGTQDEAAFRIFAEVLLSEPDGDRRRELAACLDRVAGPGALTLAVSLLAATEDAIIVGAVIRTVGRMADADTVDFLVELHGEEAAIPGQSENARAALAAIRNPEATPGLAMLLTPGYDPRLAAGAISALSATGTPEAYGAFLEAFEAMPAGNYTLRTAMLSELAAARNPQSRDFLQSLAADETAQPLFREAAREALVRMKGDGNGAGHAPVIAGVMPVKGR